MRSYMMATRRWGYLLLCMLIILLSIALSRPTWGTAPVIPVHTVRDVMALVDVSRSMLAEDQPPLSRLQRVRQYLLDLLEHLRTESGQTRLGLVVFAGQVRLLCPPTEDLEHLTFLVRELDTGSLGLQGRTLQYKGTVIGTSLAAVLQWMKSWLVSQPDARSKTDWLLLTDGDDQTTPSEVLQATEGLPSIHVLMAGDAQRAWPIPDGSGSLMKIDPVNGKTSQVMTQANNALLQQLADVTGGTLLREDNPQPLVTWWQRTVKPKPGRPVTHQVRQMPVDQTGKLLVLVLIIQVVELIWGGSRRVKW
jgi:Ca-activated chloride channel family protein